MPKKRDQKVRIVAVPREGGPDLDRIAKAIVALALKQLQEPTSRDVNEASPPDGAAA